MAKVLAVFFFVGPRENMLYLQKVEHRINPYRNVGVRGEARRSVRWGRGPAKKDGIETSQDEVELK